MTVELIFAGFGGQGVMSMGMAMTYAAMFEGMQVSWLPSYGPEMRGGTANCMVVISDKPVASPLVTDPDYAIVMNGPSFRKFGSHVKPGGVLLANASLIPETERLARNDVQVIYIPALDIAREAGDERVANMVMLGALVGLTGIVKLSSAKSALEEVLSGKRLHLLQANERALQEGASLTKAG